MPTEGEPRGDGLAVDAFCEYLRLVELDEGQDFEAFVGLHPELEGELWSIHAEWQRVSSILERLAPSASFSDHLRARYGEGADPGISLSGDEPAAEGRPSSSSSRSSERVMQRLAARQPRARRYEARREIARGGMGAILKVWDSDLRRNLAMKVMLGAKQGTSEKDSDEAYSNERRLSRFLEEAQITGQLDHPGICPVHDLGLDAEGRVYFTMNLIEGRDLREIFDLARLGRDGWDVSRVLQAMIRVCEAMAYAHDKGVVHRDLKPANIMVGRFGETYVMDWGLAKVLGREDAHDLRLQVERKKRSSRVVTDRSESGSGDDSPLKTMDGDVVGTPAYMAPEQAQGRMGEVCIQSDVYSVGAMLYHLLAGQMPYEPLGEKVPAHTILEAVRNGPPWPLDRISPDLPSELVALCEKAMSRRIGDRYDGMMDLAEDLRAYSQGRPIGAYETGALYQFRKWVARNKAISVALTSIFLIVVMSVAVFIKQQQDNLDKLLVEQAKTISAEDDARAQAQLANASKEQMQRERDRAEEQAERASRSESLAQLRAARIEQQSYRALIIAADYSLRLNETARAKQSLDTCRLQMRGWEWDHLELGTSSSLGEPLQVGVGIADLSASLDGRRVFVGCQDTKSRAWDLERGELVGVYESAVLTPFSNPRAGQIAVATDAKGIYLASAALGDTVTIVNVGTERQVGRFLHGSTVTSLAFANDGRRIVSTGSDGKVRIWDGPQQDLLAIFDGHSARANTAAFSPSDRWVASGDDDGGLAVWNAETAELRVRLEGHHTAAIHALAWSPRGDFLLSASSDETIALWEVPSGRLLTIMRGHRGAVRTLTFGPQGLDVFSGGEDATLRQWSVEDGKLRRVFRGHSQAITGIALRGGTGELVTSSLDGTLRRWDPDWDPSLSRLAGRRPRQSLAFAPDSRRLFAGSRRGGIAIWDLEAGSCLTDNDQPDFRQHALTPPLLASSVSADGQVAASARVGGGIRLWDPATGELLSDLVGHERTVSCLAFDPSGRWLASGSRLGSGSSDRSVRVWDLTGEEPTRVLDGHRRGLSDVVFSPDGSLLASVGVDKSLRLWRVLDGRPLDVWNPAHDMRINSVVFSPDGARLASASTDGTIKLWTPGEARPVVLRGHDRPVTALAYSPDGGRLVSGHSDSLLQVWGAQAGEVLLELSASSGGVTDLAFSPDGRRIACCTDGEGLLVFESGLAEARHAAQRAARERERLADFLLDGLFQRYRWPAVVSEALRADTALAEDVRAEALRLAGLRELDDAFIEASCRRANFDPALEEADRRHALEAARHYVARTGDSSSSAWLVGAAELRGGDVDAALRSLERARALEEEPSSGMECCLAFFLSMTYAELGREEQARTEYERGLLALAGAADYERRELNALLEEVQERLDGSRGD